jgi:hypothetical protein
VTYRSKHVGPEHTLNGKYIAIKSYVFGFIIR